MSRILILGGDGYLGWPTALYFSERGHEVTVVDNYLRRNIAKQSDVSNLFPVPKLEERAKIWLEKTGRKLKVVIGDLADEKVMRSLFDGTANFVWPNSAEFAGLPDAIVHYAEQPSAPYSMMSQEGASLTIQNNLLVTSHLMYAVRDFSPSSHIIKLGTMGEYGTPNIDIEEGWLEVEHKGRRDRFLYPRQASSIYHTTKIMDTDLLWFGVRTWNLRVTDLMQGPVYGVDTEETVIDARLSTGFSYDYIFGTAINRFVTQAVAGYPLTVYGKGNQVRGYLNIKDAIQCVGLAEENPAEIGELRILNQIVETFTINELASLTQQVGSTIGLNVEIKNVLNPRKESEDHYYNPVYQGLKDLGLQPHFLTLEVMKKMLHFVERYKENIRWETIFRPSIW